MFSEVKSDWSDRFHVKQNEKNIALIENCGIPLKSLTI